MYSVKINYSLKFKIFMKTIVYIVTAIMISGILISAIPFNKNNENICISLKCKDALLNESLMEESALIIENRLKDIGYKPLGMTIAEQGVIEICFKNEKDMNKVKHLLTIKGKFELYETIDRNTILKILKKDELFSGLIIPDNNNKKTPNSVLGWYSVNSIPESNEFIESLNKEFSEDIKFALSKFESKEKNRSLYILRPAAFLDRNSITDLNNYKDKETGAYFISMNFGEKGTKKWAEITRKNIGKEIAMVLDGEVYSAPKVMAEIKEGKSVISGNFSKDEASVLIALIKNGELPLEFKIIQ
jgi:preprotein translocase subunit SecD